jgi:hypothetical protein
MVINFFCGNVYRLPILDLWTSAEKKQAAISRYVNISHVLSVPKQMDFEDFDLVT